MGILDGLRKLVETVIFDDGNLEEYRQFQQRQANPEHYLNLVTDANGRLRYDHGQWIQGDMRFTVNPTDDPEAPGGTFVCMEVLGTNGKAIQKSTVVFDANGYVANTSSNRKGGWI